jgi:porin
VLVDAPIARRPHGQFSFGIQTGLLSRGFRAALADQGVAAAGSEAGIEFTYADRLAPFLTLQPDLHYVRRAYPTGRKRGVFAFGLRLIAAFAR